MCLSRLQTGENTFSPYVANICANNKSSDQSVYFHSLITTSDLLFGALLDSKAKISSLYLNKLICFQPSF